MDEFCQLVVGSRACVSMMPNSSINCPDFLSGAYVFQVHWTVHVHTQKSHKLQQVCKQAVNKLCSHGLLQVVNKFGTSCNNLVDIVKIVTRLFQQGCYNHDITILLQPCVVNLVTFLLYHDCIRLVRTTL